LTDTYRKGTVDAETGLIREPRLIPPIHCNAGVQE
jgi:hypothetical protein